MSLLLSCTFCVHVLTYLFVKIPSPFLQPSSTNSPSNRIIHVNRLMWIPLYFSLFHTKMYLLIPVHIYPFMGIYMYIHNIFLLNFFFHVVTGVGLLHWRIGDSDNSKIAHLYIVLLTLAGHS